MNMLKPKMRRDPARRLRTFHSPPSSGGVCRRARKASRSASDRSGRAPGCRAADRRRDEPALCGGRPAVLLFFLPNPLVLMTHARQRDQLRTDRGWGY
jgi:hypothetical protein